MDISVQSPSFKEISTNNNRKTIKRTLFSSIFVSLPPLILVCIALVLGQSSIQFAVFLRRTAEFVVVVLGYAVYCITTKDAAYDEVRKAKLERCVNVFAGLAMCFAGILVLLIAALSFGGDKGNVILGLIVALVGVVVNSYYWRRYSTMYEQEQNPILYAQKHIYRGKAIIDGFVIIALLVILLAPNSPICAYVDLAGSIIAAAYMVFGGIQALRNASKEKASCYTRVKEGKHGNE